MRRGLRTSFVLSRLLHARMLVLAVLAAIFIAAALTTAIIAFSERVVPQAARHQVAAAPDLAVMINGAFGQAQVAPDTAAIRTSMERAFGTPAIRLDTALWSDPLGLPPGTGAAGPAGRPGRARRNAIVLTAAASFAHLAQNAILTSGTWPGPPRTGGAAAPGAGGQRQARGAPGARGARAGGEESLIPAVLPAVTAARLALDPGDLLTTTDRITGARDRFLITGTYRPRDPAAPYWGLNLIGTSGVSVSGNFVTYGPLLVNPASIGRGGLPVGQASWVVIPDPGQIPAGSLRELAGRVSRAGQDLSQNSSLGGLTVTTTVPSLLAGIATSEVVARSTLIISLLELLLLAAAALALTARLLAGQRENESALLSARGLTRAQQARLAGTEGLLLAAAATAAGAVTGLGLAAVLARAGPLRVLAAGAVGPGAAGSGATVPAAIWWTGCGILVLAAGIILWPSLRPTDPGAARAARGRQARLAGIARAGGDGAVIAVAAVAVWQLRYFTAVPRLAGGRLGIDPVLAVAPALALAGAALVPVRLIPLIARAADALSARGRRLTGALASWQISRRPVRQAGPVLLAVLAVATGTLALAQHESWQRAARDQAAFAAGADVRVDLTHPLPAGGGAAVAGRPAVTGAMPVATFPGNNGESVLALDAGRAAGVALLRADLAPRPAGALWRLITPGKPGPGLTLPGRPARIAVTATAGMPGRGPRIGSLAVSVTIEDGYGMTYAVTAGRLPDDGRAHRLVARLAAPLAAGQSPRAAGYPLRLLAISLSYSMLPYPAAAPDGRYPTPAAARAASRAERIAAGRDAVLTIGAMAASPRTSGPFPAPFAAGAALRSWTPTVSSPDLPANSDASGIVPRELSWGPGPEQGQQLTFRAGTGHLVTVGGVLPITGSVSLTAASPQQAVLPAIATASFLHASHAAVGSELFETASLVSFPVRIVAAVRDFPTVTGAAGGVIVDLAAVQERLAAAAAAPLPVTQWWLRTAGGVVPRGLPAGSSVTSARRLAAALAGNPLAAAPQQAVLATAVAAALLAALGFATSVAASVAERRSNSALLAALGVSRAAQAGQLCLEESLLCAPAAAAGVAIGAGLAWLLIPAVTVTATATAPVPPVLVQVPLGWAAALAAVVTAVPVLAAALTALRRPDPAAELRTAEAT